jgi:hypothetical protein
VSLNELVMLNLESPEGGHALKFQQGLLSTLRKQRVALSLFICALFFGVVAAGCLFLGPRYEIQSQSHKERAWPILIGSAWSGSSVQHMHLLHPSHARGWAIGVSAAVVAIRCSPLTSPDAMYRNGDHVRWSAFGSLHAYPSWQN